MDISSRREVVAVAEFGRRATEARELFEARGAPVPSQAWLAARASSFLTGDEISQPTVGKWLAGETLPDTPLRMWAFAMALAVDPGWLAFGSESSARGPAGSLLPRRKALGPTETPADQQYGAEAFEPQKKRRAKPRRRRA